MRATKQFSSPGPFVGDQGSGPNWYDPERFTDLSFLLPARTGGSNQPTFAAITGRLFSWRFVANDYLQFNSAQMPHSWDLGLIFPHVHFSSDTGGTGNITFRQSLYSRPAGSGQWSVENTVDKTWTGTLPALGCGVLDLWDGAGYQPVFGNAGTSTIFGGRLTLLSKTIAGNVFVDAWDAHFNQNRSGTLTQFGPS